MLSFLSCQKPQNGKYSMPRPKSIIRRVAVDRAKRAHNCQSNSAHRIQGGECRLKVWTDNKTPDHYCVACGLAIIDRDIKKLQTIEDQLKA
jgi:Zn ribbon nucleic-acid-binding protein